MASAGEVQAVRIVRDKVSKACKGFAFVLFKERRHVKAALLLWGVEVLGRPIRVMKVEQQGVDAWSGDAVSEKPKKDKGPSDSPVSRFVEQRRQKELRNRMARAAKKKVAA